MSAEEKLAADPQIRLDQAALDPMIAATAHRGPADAGIDAAAWLPVGHNRLKSQRWRPSSSEAN